MDDDAIALTDTAAQQPMSEAHNLLIKMPITEGDGRPVERLEDNERMIAAFAGLNGKQPVQVKPFERMKTFG